VKKLLALLVAGVFVAGSAGLALAQAPTPAPADKKVDQPAEKKMPVKNAHGMVKSATADSVVVAGKQKKKEVEWTFAVDAKTAIKKGSKSITAADLKAGDTVHVRYMDANGKAVAQAITVQGGGMAKKDEGKPAEKK
jgi:hypothetical protein